MKIEKFEKLVAGCHNKEKYVTHIRKLKQTLNNGMLLRHVHRVSILNHKAWLSSHIDRTITRAKKKSKNDFEKYFLKSKIAVFGKKNMENVIKYRNIKLVTTESKRHYLVSEPNYHTSKKNF